MIRENDVQEFSEEERTADQEIEEEDETTVSEETEQQPTLEDIKVPVRT